MSSFESTPAEIPATLAPARLKKASLWANWQIASLLIATGVSFVGFGIVSPLRSLYARAEGASGAEVGLMAAVYVFSSFVFLFPFGWLSDRVSRIGLIVGGLAAHGLIMTGFLYLTSAEAFIGLRFLEGIATAAVMPATRALLADLVPYGRNGEAFGLMSAVMTFGIFAGPPVGTFLAGSFGYTPAYWLAAAVFIPSIGLVLLSFRAGRVPVHHHTGEVKPAHVAQTIAPGRLWTRPVLIGSLVRVSMSLGPGLGMTVWSIYMADLGYDLSLIGWTYTVYAIPIVLVSPLAGRFSDRYGRLLLMLVPGTLLGFCWISYGLFPFFLYLLLMGIVEGTFDGIARSANDGYLADHTPEGMRGRAQSLFSAATQFGSLVGALGSGLLYEFGHAVPFFVIGGLQVSLVLVAAGLALADRRKR